MDLLLGLILWLLVCMWFRLSSFGHLIFKKSVWRAAPSDPCCCCCCCCCYCCWWSYAAVVMLWCCCCRHCCCCCHCYVAVMLLLCDCYDIVVVVVVIVVVVVVVVVVVMLLLCCCYLVVILLLLLLLLFVLLFVLLLQTHPPFPFFLQAHLHKPPSHPFLIFVALKPGLLACSFLVWFRACFSAVYPVSSSFNHLTSRICFLEEPSPKWEAKPATATESLQRSQAATYSSNVAKEGWSSPKLACMWKA